ncbi:hypothetical protein [Streptomyces sp. NBC_01367]|uniref:hypothetical protein n=1 Tax=Streptomyces sp. NBC_01367 TaxID=2903841 RepID=UPI003254EC34
MLHSDGLVQDAQQSRRIFQHWARRDELSDEWAAEWAAYALPHPGVLGWRLDGRCCQELPVG